MLSIRTLLHPTDFSGPSSYALDLARALARDHGARLILLHVAYVPPVAFGEGIVPPDSEALFHEAQQRLEQLQVPETALSVVRRFEQGDPADVILRVAREDHADLIVMGTHGRTGLSRLLMGSVAEQVVRQAPCPVVTVRGPVPQVTAASPAEAGHA